MTDDFSFRERKEKVFASCVRVEKIVWSLAINHQFHLETFFLLRFLVIFPPKSLEKCWTYVMLYRAGRCRCERENIFIFKSVFRSCVEEKDEEEGRTKMLRKRNAFQPRLQCATSSSQYNSNSNSHLILLAGMPKDGEKHGCRWRRFRFHSKTMEIFSNFLFSFKLSIFFIFPWWGKIKQINKHIKWKSISSIVAWMKE